MDKNITMDVGKKVKNPQLQGGYMSSPGLDQNKAFK